MADSRIEERALSLQVPELPVEVHHLGMRAGA